LSTSAAVSTSDGTRSGRLGRVMSSERRLIAMEQTVLVDVVIQLPYLIARSTTLDRNDTFETGRKFAMSAVSRPGFLRRGNHDGELVAVR